jgi:hypothetical protein
VQQDFHFYAIAVLARAAGFPLKDALTIAYASQYVDDSTESSLIRLDIDHGELRFDPVRTASTGLQYRSWSTHKRVFVPFHFLPPKPFRPGENGAFSFVTKPGSAFAEQVLHSAAAEPLANRKRRLCRIGIALHTFADTWSHQGFSGRHHKTENEVDDLEAFDEARDSFRRLRLETMISDRFVPPIGHAKAGRFADLSFLRWRYRTADQGAAPVERDNVAICLNASKAIHDRLSTMENPHVEPGIPWAELEPEFRAQFAMGLSIRPGLRDRILLASSDAYEVEELGIRCDRWKATFRHLFGPHPNWYDYDKKLWRTWAVQGDIEWDAYTRGDWAHADSFVPQPNFWNSLWVHFHRAALKQRHFVLENLP